MTPNPEHPMSQGKLHDELKRLIADNACDLTIIEWFRDNFQALLLALATPPRDTATPDVEGNSRTGNSGAKTQSARDSASKSMTSREFGDAATEQRVADALRPFAKYAQLALCNGRKDCERIAGVCPLPGKSGEDFAVTVGDFRNAESVLALLDQRGRDGTESK